MLSIFLLILIFFVCNGLSSEVPLTPSGSSPPISAASDKTNLPLPDTLKYVALKKAMREKDVMFNIPHLIETRLIGMGSGTVLDRNVRILSTSMLFSIYFGSHMTFVKSLIYSYDEDESFQQFMDQKIKFSDVEVTLQEYLTFKGIFGILKDPIGCLIDFRPTIIKELKSLAREIYPEIYDKIKRFITLFPKLTPLQSPSSIFTYQTLLNEIVHGNTDVLSLSQVTNQFDKKNLVSFYNNNAPYYWFKWKGDDFSTPFPMAGLGYSKNELEMITNVCYHIEVPVRRHFMPGSDLQKVINPLNLDESSLLKSIIVEKGLFYAYSKDTDRLLSNLTKLLELYFYSWTRINKKTCEINFTRFFLSLIQFKESEKAEIFGISLLRFFLQVPEAETFAKKIFQMTEEEKVLLDEWQYFFKGFKSRFASSNNLNRIENNLKELLASGSERILPSLIGRAMHESIWSKQPFNKVFEEILISSMIKFEKSEDDSSVSKNSPSSWIYLKQAFKPLLEKLSTCEYAFEAVYYLYHDSYKVDIDILVSVIKSLALNRNDRIGLFIENLPYKEFKDDFSIYSKVAKIISETFFQGVVNMSDVVFIKNLGDYSGDYRRKEVINSLHNLSDGMFFSSIQFRRDYDITSNGEIFVLLNAVGYPSIENNKILNNL